MPAGNSSPPNNSLLDLQGFLARKRITPKQWLTANNITSVEALGRLIRGSKWFVAPELRSEFESALISLPGPVANVQPIAVEKPEHTVEEEEEPSPKRTPGRPKSKTAATP